MLNSDPVFQEANPKQNLWNWCFCHQIPKYTYCFVSWKEKQQRKSYFMVNQNLSNPILRDQQDSTGMQKDNYKSTWTNDRRNMGAINISSFIMRKNATRTHRDETCPSLYAMTSTHVVSIIQVQLSTPQKSDKGAGHKISKRNWT